MIDRDYESEQAALRELSANERLLWAGRPAPLRQAIQALPLALFGIPFTIFACSWTFGAGAFSGVFALVGVLFLLVGIKMLTSPLWSYAKAKSTVYAVTDKRALVIRGGGARAVTSYEPADIGEIDRREKSDGSGDLIFGRPTSYLEPGPMMPLTGAKGVTTFAPGGTVRRTGVRAGFYGIPDVRAVEQHLRNLVSPPQTTTIE